MINNTVAKENGQQKNDRQYSGKRKRTTKGQTNIYKAIHRKLKID